MGVVPLGAPSVDRGELVLLMKNVTRSRGEDGLQPVSTKESVLEMALLPNSYFGDEALLTSHAKNIAVQAKALSYLYALAAEDFSGVLLEFPECRDIFEVCVCA